MQGNVLPLLGPQIQQENDTEDASGIHFHKVTSGNSDLLIELPTGSLRLGDPKSSLIMGWFWQQAPDLFYHQGDDK